MYSLDLIDSKSYEEMSREASKQIIKVMKENPTSLYCFAGGDTPVRTLELLVEAHKEKEIDLSKAFYIGLDEWVGLDENDQGSCLYYMNKNLFFPANIPKEQIHFFNAISVDLEKECLLADEFIDRHDGITLSLLGVGLNGHLGFNEPGTEFDSLSHVTNLDNITINVGKKYFEKEKKIKRGITLGIGQILESKYLILLANGKNKSKPISKLLDGKITREWPVTSLNKHENSLVITHDVL